MSPSPKSWFAGTLQFCGSCLVTLACWALWLVLSATLCCLIYIAVAKELPVPDFVLRRVEAGLAQANLAITFGRARFDPTGKILFEDVRLRSGQFEDPLVTSRLVYVRHNFWSILAGRPVPDEIRLEGAALQLPAMLSPSGTVEPLIGDLAVVLRHRDNLWQVDQFAGRIGRVAITAPGELLAPARPPGAAPLSPEAIAARFLQISRRLALEVHQFDAFEEPALAVRLDNTEGVGNTATLLFTARAANQPWGQPLVLGPLAVTTTIRLDGAGVRPVRLHAAVHHANYRGEFAVEGVRAVLTAQFLPGSFSARPVEALLAAGRLTGEDETALGPVLRADLTRWPEVHTAVATQIRGEYLAAEVEARLEQHSARVRAAGRVAPGLISSVLEKHTPRAAAYFVFGDPVEFTAEAVLDPGWHFARLASRVDAGRIDSHGVKLTAARGRIDIVGLSFLAHDARVELAGNFARGSYWMDFSTTDYRMLLQGRLNPVVINGWFRGDWWLKFWQEHFAFPTVPPEADVDVAGRWKDPVRTVYFGSSEARAASVWGGDFESVRTRVFLRPQFTHVLDFSGTRAGGAQRLDGWIKRFGDPVTRETQRLEFDFAGSLTPAIYGRMLEGKAEEVFASLQFNRPPQVRAQGSIGGKGLAAEPNYTFTASAEGGMHYFGFPLETASVSGGVSGPDVRLDDIQFATAGGKGAGKAALSRSGEVRRLGFDLYLNGADMARTIRAVEEYQVSRTGQKTTAVAESKFMKRASGGRLDVALSAEGTLGDLASFKGTGNAALTGMELAEIQLFGLLSQVLSGLSLNFSSLTLTEARTSFKLDEGRLHFPDLKISGHSAVIDARGDYTFANSALDFTAKFKPFEESRTLLTAVIGLAVNPITSILELKLTGPVSKPVWSIVVGPSPATGPPVAAKPPVPAGPAQPADNSVPPKS